MSPNRRASDRQRGRTLTRSAVGLGLIVAVVLVHIAGVVGEHVTMAVIGIGGLMANGDAAKAAWSDRQALKATAEHETP